MRSSGKSDFSVNAETKEKIGVHLGKTGLQFMQT